MSGLWTANVGHSRRELAEAAYEQMLKLPFYNTFFKTTHPPVVELARKLAEIAPDNLNQVFFASSGSESNDTAIRLIRHYWVLKGEPKRRIIISRKNAYHGSTIAAASMSGMAHMHLHSYPVYEGFRHIMDPYWYGESFEGESPDRVRPSRRARARGRDPGRRTRRTSPPLPASRCKAPAASRFRPRPIGRRCSASSTNTASCFSPTR